MNKGAWIACGGVLAVIAGISLATPSGAEDGIAPPKGNAAKPIAKPSVSSTKPATKAAADNSICFVCHLELQKEQLTVSHQAENIGCVRCHGSSADHMHDEMLMTKPDQLFGRQEVDAMCGKCHEEPHKEKAKEVKAFLDQWRGKDRPNGRVVSDRSICTDCHGTHNIVKALGAKKTQQQEAKWINAFDGRSLAGWKPSGKAVWKVRSGRIVAAPGEQPSASDLWSQAEYGNCRLSVTFRADWPIHAGIWLRGTDAAPGPRVEIFDRQQPPAHSGSVLIPGMGLALCNLRKDLVDPEGWNTISVELRGDRIQVWANGEEIGATRVTGPKKGRIGLHLEGGPSYKNAEISVREILVQPLRD